MLALPSLLAVPGSMRSPESGPKLCMAQPFRETGDLKVTHVDGNSHLLLAAESSRNERRVQVAESASGKQA